MRSLAALLFLASTVTAHREYRAQHPRQGSASPSGSAPPASGSAPPASGTAPASNATATPSQAQANYTLSFVSTNPTAMPLTDIVATPTSTDTTYPVFTAFAPGATPPVKGAPPLPLAGTIDASDWPTLDKTPPTDTTQVEAWMQELNGYYIPNFSPTVPGGCATNPGLVGNETLCWWTCGHCTRETDITSCPDKMTWGLSYDDGPSPWTPALLNYMNQENLKSTFFIVGSRAISRPQILQDEYMLGHQLCVHTWSHPYLTTLTTEQARLSHSCVVAELGWTREAIRQITGVSPNCMRPPYGDLDDRVRAISLAMGMTPIIWTSTANVTFDTNDWHIPAGTVTVQLVLETFDEILNEYAPSLNSGFIVLEHDLWPQTVDIAVGYVLPNALASKKYQMMPIISCLGRPLEDSYIETNNNASNPPAEEGLTTLPPGYTSTLTGLDGNPTGLPGSAGSGAGRAVHVVGWGAGAGALLAAAWITLL
ncbi:carbohydrate esterase family 4 protein [Calocera viscosa TUFC12733]|uniref:chitin deacetylase n=1 Tax=Calocera viscosa (strain TUFC12733) TaxID=1330018 RepID=A0A167JKZ2_CALVF|nr:carbohydrate esterase family 4 protein [Calocera viscosa TUFC12733]